MWIRNAWYVAAWAKQVTEGEPFARIYLDEPVVLYRTTDGAVTALEDRCCHRLAPLSRGRIEGDNLRCMYHGLMFDPSGACVEIPGETRIPEKYRVRRYPVVERQNVIWIWMGDEALADPGDIIDWPYLDDPAWPYEGGYLHYKSNYQLIVDNFLDFSHLPYVHEKTIGTASYAEQRPRITHTDFGLHIENTTDDTPPTPAFAPFGNFAGNVDRWSIYDFHIRGNCVVADFGMAPVGGGGHAGDRRNAIQFRHLSALTPRRRTPAITTSPSRGTSASTQRDSTGRCSMSSSRPSMKTRTLSRPSRSLSISTGTRRCCPWRSIGRCFTSAGRSTG